MEDSLEALKIRLDKSRLMSLAELEEFLEALPPSRMPSDAEALVQRLLEQSRITNYQLRQLLAGHTRGLVLGDYVILNEIGVGGMGTVFKARHRRMDRTVALKVLKPEVARSPDAVERFGREVVAAARLRHPNIVHAYDASEDDGIPFLVMEYVDGSDLADRVLRFGPLPCDIAVDYVLQATRGLDYAHARQIIHRDIKPANLLVNSDGVVKILDMGLARVGNGAPDGEEHEGLVERGLSGMTLHGRMIGTIDFVAPEQLVDPGRVDRGSDLYSVGATLFYLLTGRVVFDRRTTLEKLVAKAQEEAPSLVSCRRDVPKPLDGIVNRLLERDPDQRFSSAADLVAALTSVVDPDAPPYIPKPPPEPITKDYSQELQGLATARKFDSAVDHILDTEPDARKRRSPRRAAVRNVGMLRPVAVADLPVGGRPEYPLLQRSGRRLLPGGEVITLQLLQSLRSREIVNAWMHENDRSTLVDTQPLETLGEVRINTKLNIHTSASKKLDIDTGRKQGLEIVNAGVPVKATLLDQDGADIDQGFARDVVARYTDAVTMLTELMASLLATRRDTKLGDHHVSAIAGQFLTQLRTDIDGVLGCLPRARANDTIERHAVRLAVLAMALGIELGYDERNVLQIGLAGLLCDIGMHCVPRNLREAKRRLGNEEFALVARHTIHTADCLTKLAGLPSATHLAAYQVHERPNGVGYPRGVSLEGIHPFARILAVADVYLALVAPRPYRRAYVPHKAIGYMLRMTSHQLFDPLVIRAMLHVLGVPPLGCDVILDDARAATIVRSGRASFTRPLVTVFQNANGQVLDESELIDLASDEGRSIAMVINDSRP
ncbi:Serine/threonine-protein kinase PrkC [Planctomycetes bacterium Pan216]|uniref:Serine/threonine-protein kinase PrkC n=1 Tax=Kolteria novifilia TaxID=2527975 RepID=A0A518B2I6_9BACT|nr:Serine/threonine-protein kinase PrkC [Planctomycetes bacterium Pan216]